MNLIINLSKKGCYIRLYDENEDSKLFSFGLCCLIIGSCCIILALCWFMYEYKDRQEQLNRTARTNITNRTFFLNLRRESLNQEIYSNYLNVSRRSERWHEIRRLDLQPPPSYRDACRTASQLSFINLNSPSIFQPLNLLNENRPNLIKYLSEDKVKADQPQINCELSELSVVNLQNLVCPTYDEAMRIDPHSTNENTRL